MNRSLATLAFTGTLALAGAATSAATSAQAQTVVALFDGNMIAAVDAKTLKAGKPMKVSGVDGTLVGIDVRPADGMLYGLYADGTVATIDAGTGKATRKSKLDTMLPAGVMATVDFNPVADRLRVMGSDGTNLRANVDDGKVTKDGSLKFAETDPNRGKAPNIVAGAYTNSVKGAKETVLYDLDASVGALVRQAPPNDGVLTVVGILGGATAASHAFDIVALGSGTSEGWLMAGDTLHRVDLSTGRATPVGKVAGATAPVRDIAAMPQM